ncbi:hypothetical protein [Corynebacterium amycolatum]|nr:hypothetical protein [Corynebacterium amycolatum]EEB62401.1 hypothetical protein CORAM0001_1633 [Corynebacterium amycolatum SK46]
MQVRFSVPVPSAAQLLPAASVLLAALVLHVDQELPELSDGGYSRH